MMVSTTAEEALQRLRQEGSVGVLPTDTVYGLVARAQDPTAVKRLYALKRRERKPGTVVAASVEQLIELGVSERDLNRVKQWWPNALSAICSADKTLDYLAMGVGSLAVRVPRDERLRSWLEKTGPLVTSSANQPGEAEATNVGEARGYFGDQVDFYVDGGNLSGRAPSTIIRLNDDGDIEVVRAGAVKLDR